MRLRLFVTACLFAIATSSVLAAGRPNVIFFLSDDHRADFLSCAGHPIVQTPVIDSLAGKGVRFENAFVTTSICAASRATLLTGLWERSHKYTFGTPAIAEAKVDASYPAVLKSKGYRTGFVGTVTFASATTEAFSSERGTTLAFGETRTGACQAIA